MKANQWVSTLYTRMCEGVSHCMIYKLFHWEFHIFWHINPTDQESDLILIISDKVFLYSDAGTTQCQPCAIRGRNCYPRPFWGWIVCNGQRTSPFVWIKAETVIWASAFSTFSSAILSLRVTGWRSFLLSLDLIHVPPVISLKLDREVAVSWLEILKPGSVTLGSIASYRQIFIFLNDSDLFNLSYWDKWNAEISHDYIPYIHLSEHEYAPKRKRLRAGLSNAVNRY